MSCASALSKAFPCLFPKKPAETGPLSSAQPKPDTNNHNHIVPQTPSPAAAGSQSQHDREAVINDSAAKPSEAGTAAPNAQTQQSNRPVAEGRESISENEVTLIPAQTESAETKNGNDDLSHKLEESAMSLAKDAPAKTPVGGQQVGIVGEVGVLAGGVLGGGHVSSQMASSTSSRRESTSHRASPHGEREVRSGGEGTPSVFEPRATPRTVFKKAPAHASPTTSTAPLVGADKENNATLNNAPASRPSRPQQQIEKVGTSKVWDTPVEEHSPTMQNSVASVSDWISIDQQPTPKRPQNSNANSFVQQQSRRLNDQQEKANSQATPQPSPGPAQNVPLAGYKQLTWEDGAASEEAETMVRDGDAACEAGTRVVVSRKWLDVPYFEQFAGLVGVLTRRGLNGVMWYASFPGIIEQAFATGMHGQHVLAYAPAPSSSADRRRGQAVARAAAAAVPGPSGKDGALMAEGRQEGLEQSQRHALPPRPSGGGEAAWDKRPAPAVGGGGAGRLLDGRGVEGYARGGVHDAAVAEMRAREEERRWQLREQAAAEHAAQQLQPKNKDAVQDASLAVATDAPLAAPRGGKRSARGPLSARDKLEKRPPSARSRSQMGAPPLGSGRRPGPSPAVSARRLGGSATPDMGLSPREEWTPDSPREGGREGRLFKYPEWDEYELFDSDDLWSEHAYLLYGESMAAGQAPSVFVWLGQYFEEADYTDAASCERFALHAAHDFRRAFDSAPVGPVTVVKELEEEEDFWEYFVLG